MNTYCPQCFFSTFDGSRFCPRDGTATLPWPRCPKCDKECSPSALFCGACGARLEGEDVANASK